jgi:hypothetical protein
MRPAMARQCCRTDTLSTSFSNLSRRRQTRGQHPCFVVAWLMLVLRKRSAPRRPGALPHTPRAPGPAATSTEVPGPRAEGKDRTFATRPQSPDKGHREGDRDRERCPAAWNRAHNDYVRSIRRSVGRKMALNWNIVESVVIRTLGRAIRSTLNQLYRSGRCRDLAEECRLIAAMCASTETRDHYSRAEVEEPDVKTSRSYGP